MRRFWWALRVQILFGSVWTLGVGVHQSQATIAAIGAFLLGYSVAQVALSSRWLAPRDKEKS